MAHHLAKIGVGDSCSAFKVSLSVRVWLIQSSQWCQCVVLQVLAVCICFRHFSQSRGGCQYLASQLCSVLVFFVQGESWDKFSSPCLCSSLNSFCVSNAHFIQSWAVIIILGLQFVNHEAVLVYLGLVIVCQDISLVAWCRVFL